MNNLNLFINVLITDKPVPFASKPYDRGLLHFDNKLDVFKYMISSLSVIPFEEIHIYYTLDEQYKEREEELKNHIYNELYNDNIVFNINNTRLERSSQWRNAFYKIKNKNNFILFCCNHDHIFIDYDLNEINRILELMTFGKSKGENPSCIFSHWQETIYNCFVLSNGYYDKNNQVFRFKYAEPVSVQIITPDSFYQWNCQISDAIFCPRPDYFGFHKPPMTPTDSYLGIRELFRHYDGYSHTGYIDINYVTPLIIPTNFFSKSMMIRFYFDDNKDGWININPNKKNYLCTDINGTFEKYMPTTIPLFWKDRIKHYEYCNLTLDILDCDYNSVLSDNYIKYRIDPHPFIKFENGEFRLK